MKGNLLYLSFVVLSFMVLVVYIYNNDVKRGIYRRSEEIEYNYNCNE